MFKEVLCPHCRQVVPIDPVDPVGDSAPTLEGGHTVEVTLPRTHVDDGVGDGPARPHPEDGAAPTALAAPPPRPEITLPDGSNDGLVLGEPDPILGAFIPPEIDSGPLGPAIAASAAAPAPEPASYPDLGLNLGPVATSPAPAADPGPGAGGDDEEDDEGEDDARTPLGIVLLASYASAVTMALLYVLWTHRNDRPRVDASRDDSRPDRSADGARPPAPPPIAADHRLAIGRPTRVGSVELTPLEVRFGRVQLEGGADGPREEPGETLQLRLRLANLSDGSTFAPLDAALARTPVRGMPETFVQPGRGGIIDPFPLAPESEMAIAGQSFAPLAPGESREVVLSTEPDVRGRLVDPLVWRLRVRVRPDAVETVGLSFRADEVR